MAGPTMTIPADIARRFLLGRQGLWPSRHWRGRSGALAAVRALGSVQMDPVTLVACNHDLVLWGRVIDYRPANLHNLLYVDRALFDYGGVLRIQPIEELPHWRLHMERRREDERHYLPLVREHPGLFDAVRATVERNGPLPARLIAERIGPGTVAGDATSGRTAGSYRSQSVINRVAYQLWMTGELMTDHREGFERHYDLAERLVPAELLAASDEPAAAAYFPARIVAAAGLITPGALRSAMAYALHRPIDRAEAAAWTDRLVDGGEAITVAVAGQRGRLLAPASAEDQLRQLQDDAVPGDWEPLPSITGSGSGVSLLSPLDPVVKGTQAKTFFGFEHRWEIYKPAAKRRWGPFTMPILYGDALVGRVDPRLDRATATLCLNGIWLETSDLADDAPFAAALSKTLRDLAGFLGADRITPDGPIPNALGRRLAL